MGPIASFLCFSQLNTTSDIITCQLIMLRHFAVCHSLRRVLIVSPLSSGRKYQYSWFLAFIIQAKVITREFGHPAMQIYTVCSTACSENTKVLLYGSLVRKSMDGWWFPSQKACNVESTSMFWLHVNEYIRKLIISSECYFKMHCN